MFVLWILLITVVLATTRVFGTSYTGVMGCVILDGVCW
jgi:hypothetical protein